METKNEVKNVLLFIEKYRELEKLPVNVGQNFLKNIFTGEPAYKVDHLLDQWKWKKREFGSFYMNLDVALRIKLYNYFGIFDAADDNYVANIVANPISTMFLDQSITCTNIKNIIVFFLNHGIDETPASWLDLPLSSLPSGKLRFGNATNWGQYILSIKGSEQIKIIETILIHYQQEKLK